VLSLPTVEILPLEDYGPLDTALERLEAYHWVCFASRNAVRAVFERLETRGWRLPEALRVAAVGPSTAAEIEGRGVNVQCVPGEATGMALAAELAGRGVAGQRILLPVGDISRPDLREGLEAAGARVDRVVVYRTVRPEQADAVGLAALRRGEVDVVALASPSAARNLTEMLDGDVSHLQAARLVCIGPTTAGAVRELGLEPATVAEPHTVEGLVAAIVQLYALDEDP
jgi:uroporphyrinogen-III synthase